MDASQLWLRLTYWFYKAPGIYIPTLMDIIAVVILLVLIKRFREMRWPLLAMYGLVLIHAFILPYSYTGDSTLRILLQFPILVFWTPGLLICFISCQAAASRLENVRDRKSLLVCGLFFLIYLPLHIVLLFS